MITTVAGKFSYYSARMETSQMYEAGMIGKSDYGIYVMLLNELQYNTHFGLELEEE